MKAVWICGAILLATLAWLLWSEHQPNPAPQAQPKPRPQPTATVNPPPFAAYGLVFAPAQPGIPSGFEIETLHPLAAQYGFEQQDRIVQVNQYRLSHPDRAEQQVISLLGANQVTLVFYRQGQRQSLTITLPN